MLLDNIHIKPKTITPPKARTSTVPIAPTPSTRGMGITLERTTAATAHEAQTTERALAKEVSTAATPLRAQTQTSTFLSDYETWYRSRFNIVKNPRAEITPTTEEEFFARINSKVFSEHGMDFPVYNEQEKAKLMELFKKDPVMVQYLEGLQQAIIRGQFRTRFNPDEIEKFLDCFKTDEEFFLKLINKTKADGSPQIYAYDFNTLINSYKRNPQATKFLYGKQLGINDIEKLVKLQKTNPKQYQQILESGMFDLVEAGKLPQNIFKNLRENMFFTENFLKDVRKVQSGAPLVTEIPQGTSLENIGKFVENGEVGVLNGKLYANQGGKAVELQLSREKFEELFPYIERFKMEQGCLGDCWLISAIDNMMGNPSQRVNLYKLFSQQGNDILIKYPYGKNALRFVNGEIYESKDFMNNGAKGLKMLEQSFVFHRAGAYTKGAQTTDVVARLSENPQLIYKLDGGQQGYFTDAVEGLDNLLSLQNWKNFFKTEIYRPIKFRLKTIGQDHSTHSELSRWKREKSSDIVIYNCEREGAASGREISVCYDYDLHAPHGYAVRDYAIADRIATITNPHHTEVHIQAPLDILEDYGYITRFKSV